jgi:hypothetical protein
MAMAGIRIRLPASTQKECLVVVHAAVTEILVDALATRAIEQTLSEHGEELDLVA